MTILPTIFLQFSYNDCTLATALRDCIAFLIVKPEADDTLLRHPLRWLHVGCDFTIYWLGTTEIGMPMFSVGWINGLLTVLIASVGAMSPGGMTFWRWHM